MQVRYNLSELLFEVIEYNLATDVMNKKNNMHSIFIDTLIVTINVTIISLNKLFDVYFLNVLVSDKTFFKSEIIPK